MIISCFLTNAIGLFPWNFDLPIHIILLDRTCNVKCYFTFHSFLMSLNRNRRYVKSALTWLHLYVKLSVAFFALMMSIISYVVKNTLQ